MQNLIKWAHEQITRIKGRDYAPNVHEIQSIINQGARYPTPQQIMKIKLNEGQVAVLFHDADFLVACIKATDNAKEVLEKAASEHFCCDCTLVDVVDFDSTSDYHADYRFRLHNSEDGLDDDIILTTLTCTAIY